MSAKRYDLEQQEQIARMVVEGGKSGNQISEELGINRNSVYIQLQQIQSGSTFFGAVHIIILFEDSE
jgi:DNA-binding CsgD family transcriptional regulator